MVKPIQPEKLEKFTIKDNVQNKINNKALTSVHEIEQWSRGH